MKKKLLIISILSILLFPLLLVIIIAGAMGGSTTSSSTTGQQTSLTASEVADKAGISEERAEDVIKILNYQLSQENFMLAGSAGSLAVAERESGFDPKAVNTDGGVAGYFQWSGWSSTINGNRWAKAKQKKLDSDIELDLLSTELNGSYSKGKTEMQKATNPEEATLYWSEHYEGVALADGQTKADELKKDAKKWYEIFKDTLTGGNSSNLDNTVGDISSNGSTYSDFNFPSNLLNEEQLQLGKPSSSLVSSSLKGNTYPVGQCTWYAFNRLSNAGVAVFNYLGNGQDWVANLAGKGWSTGSTPKVSQRWI